MWETAVSTHRPSNVGLLFIHFIHGFLRDRLNAPVKLLLSATTSLASPSSLFGVQFGSCSRFQCRPIQGPDALLSRPL